MVRIFKVKHLEERRRLLVSRSEIYRQTLRLQIVSLKLSASEFKQQFGFLNNVRRLLGLAASVAGIIQRQTGSEKGRGLVSRLLSGVKFAAEFVRLLKKSGGSSTAAEKRDDPAPAADIR